MIDTYSKTSKFGNLFKAVNVIHDLKKDKTFFVIEFADKKESFDDPITKKNQRIFDFPLNENMGSTSLMAKVINDPKITFHGENSKTNPFKGATKL